jgi:hypothetical protein
MRMPRQAYPPPAALLEFLQPYDPTVQQLALTVRAFVLEELAPCCEYFYDAYNAVALGYGPNNRYQDGAIHIAVYSKHVNLGFNRGASLHDPARILKGTGKNIRHITIEQAADLDPPEIRNYIQRAREDVVGSVGPAWPEDGVVSTVKSISPTRRRPR